MDINNIYKAQENLKDIIINTPIFDASILMDNLYIKAENVQKTGSFKLRGAYNKISTLTQKEIENGVICASAGNHAQGVGFTCKKMNIKGIVVMPENAPISKIEATREYGVEVKLVGNTFYEAYEYALNYAKENNLTFIEPYDDEKVIAGQATIGLELIDKLEDNDVVLVPIGGGGLASGVAYAIKTLKPNVLVYGVQSNTSQSMYKSLEANKIVESSVETMADGIAVRKPGKLTYEICKKYLDGIVLVDDKEVAAAILLMLEKLKLVTEGAGAIAVAAAIFNKINYNNKCYAIVSGGNIDINYLANIIELGLHKINRRYTLNLTLKDKPTTLKKIIDMVSEVNANIITIDHNRMTDEILNKQCIVSMTIETIDYKQFKELVNILENNNYTVKKDNNEYIVKEL